MRHATFALFCAVVFVGCYNYKPIGQTAPQGTEVAIDLSDQGTAELASKLGPGVEHMRGKIVVTEGDEFVLAVVATEKENGVETFWNGENVTIKRSHVARMRERELSKSRTALVVAGIILAAVAIGAAATGASLFDFGGGDGGSVGQ